jgi:hypothetical protein
VRKRCGDALDGIGLALAVMLGVFGAHALEDQLAHSKGVCAKAVFYHFCARAGVADYLSSASDGGSIRDGRSDVCWLLCAGILIFAEVCMDCRTPLLGRCQPDRG